MAYDQSDVEFYQWQEFATFGTTSIVRYVVGPRGKVGFVRDIEVDITTSMVGTTTVPEIQIGISSGDFTYGRYRLGVSSATGYATGPYRASAEAITGNPPRTLADYTGHVVIDGGPLTSKGIAGGSYGTVVPAGRIPASGWVINNVIQGVDSSHSRIFANGSQPFKDMVTGNLVSIQGVVGSTSVNANKQAITAIDTVNYQYIEVAQSFTTAYTSGGIIWLDVVVTFGLGVGGSPAGGGVPRVKIEWLGAETV
jgi:hypothetical protein